MSARFPFPEFPRGWFAAGFSKELRRGQLLSRTWMGEEMVLFRDNSGATAALGAYCPHLGAHLGKGGLVQQGELHCPFHAFGFDGEGRCVSTPYGGRVPALQARRWRTAERNGVILVWHDPGGTEPGWTVPELPATGSWGALYTRSYLVRTHPQETTENSVDFGHLGELHGYREVRQVGELCRDRHALRVGFAFRRRAGVLGQRNRWIDVFSDVTVLGLGYSLVEVRVPELGLETRHLILPTPERNGRVALRAAMRMKRITNPALVSAFIGAARPAVATAVIGRLVFEGFLRDLRQDFAIWENKRYIHPPGLAEGDGPIGRYRQWCRQFYGQLPGGEA